MDEVYMEVPAVRNIAKTFGQIADVLKRVAQVLEALVNILKGTAFIGLVGGAAVITFIEMIKPHIEEMAEKCEELNKDIDFSVDAYENGDEMGATRFH